MGKIEDLMVYTKLVILAGISVVLIKFGSPNITVFSQQLTDEFANFPLLYVLIVSSVTFVAYEGFQLVINAVNEMRNPQRNIPRAIYTAIALAILIYLVISVGALLAIPTADIIKNKEFALAAGAEDAIGTLAAIS
jgi:amino acid transporter